MKLDKYLIGFVVFVFIFFGMLGLVNNINQNYDANIETKEFNETFNIINETYTLEQDIDESMLGGDVEGADQSWESLVKNSYTSIRKSVTGSFKIVFAVTGELAKILGLPQWVITLTLTAIGLSVIFAFIFLIFRFRG